eukprot:scaffold230992_cov35-Prasinocladus_malaysianus.AAC.2
MSWSVYKWWGYLQGVLQRCVAASAWLMGPDGGALGVADDTAMPDTTDKGQVRTFSHRSRRHPLSNLSKSVH